MKRTIVALNAHPDDEALLMAGTLAKAAAAGHRVVLVTATDGDLGLAASRYRDDGRLGERRLGELTRSAHAIGAQRLVYLGYADSGSSGEVLPDPPGRTRLVHADTEEVAGRVADLLREERADLLIGYDANGGYGHRDHVAVHEIARAAAALTHTRLLEATFPRDLLGRGAELAARLRLLPPEFDTDAFARAWAPRADITHRIDVRRHAGAKRDAMRAHASQATADGGADRTLAALLRVPRPLYDVLLGWEWFVDAGAPGARPIRHDVLDDGTAA